MRSEVWPYYAAGIDYKVNTKITAVNVAAKKLTAESGDTISYEKLIVATGARVSRVENIWNKMMSEFATEMSQQQTRKES